jgi:hypothetical protein
VIYYYSFFVKPYLLHLHLFLYEELYKFRGGNGCKVSDLERDLKDLNFNKLSLDEQLSLEGVFELLIAHLKVTQNL